MTRPQAMQIWEHPRDGKILIVDYTNLVDGRVSNWCRYRSFTEPNAIKGEYFRTDWKNVTDEYAVTVVCVPTKAFGFTFQFPVS